MIEASWKQPVYLKYQIYTKFRSQVLSHLLAPRISVWLDYTSKHKDTRTCSYEKLSFVLLSILFQTNLEGWMGGWCGMNEARAWKGGRRGKSVGRGREGKGLGWCRVGFGVVGGWVDGGRGGEGKENMHIIKKLVNYLYLTAHLDSVLRSAKFDISLEFS